jgi:hypothetical protein
MRTRIKTRVADLLLLSFIVVFVARATPNLDVLPNIPWAQDRTNGDLANTDDKRLGNYARMKFLETHPPEGTPTLKPAPVWEQQTFTVHPPPKGVKV